MPAKQGKAGFVLSCTPGIACEGKPQDIKMLFHQKSIDEQNSSKILVFTLEQSNQAN